jgi:hypothetical protein
MVDSGSIDFLTGDWLAELTMLILWKSRQRDASKGWARTFLSQMEAVLGTCSDRGIKVVTNAGADVVICPRITDASLVVGPAAWHHGWSPTDWD